MACASAASAGREVLVEEQIVWRERFREVLREEAGAVSSEMMELDRRQ